MDKLLPILSILMFPVGIAYFICWVMIIIRAFKKEEGPLMGILCIVLCSLGALVIGWMNAKKWDCKKLMLIYTFLMLIFGLVFGLVAAASIAANSLQELPS